MPEPVTQPACSAKNLATEVATSEPQRRAKAPEWLMVSRAMLTHPSLTATDALIQAGIAYRRCHGQEVTDTALGEWLRIDPTTVGRSRKKVDALGTPFPAVDGWIRTDVREARRYGALAAVALGQLRSWCSPEHGSARFRGRHFVVNARTLADRIGCCAKTASEILKRLQGAKKLLRRLTATCIEVVWTNGLAAAVRLLGERERPQAEPVAPKVPAAPGAPPPAREHKVLEAASAAIVERFLRAAQGP